MHITEDILTALGPARANHNRSSGLSFFCFFQKCLVFTLQALTQSWVNNGKSLNQSSGVYCCPVSLPTCEHSWIGAVALFSFPILLLFCFIFLCSLIKTLTSPGHDSWGPLPLLLCVLMVLWHWQTWQEFALATRMFTGTAEDSWFASRGSPLWMLVLIFTGLRCVSVMSWKCFSFGIFSEPFFLCGAGQAEMWDRKQYLYSLERVKTIHINKAKYSSKPVLPQKHFVFVRTLILKAPEQRCSALYGYASKNLFIASSAYFVEGPSVSSLLTLLELCIGQFNNRLDYLIKQEHYTVLHSGSPVRKQQSQTFFSWCR